VVIKLKYRRIRDLREDKDLTQAQLGEAIGVPQRTLSYYENGQRMVPLEVLSAIADFFGVSVDYILERTDNPKTNK
jgi:transcriptional regulator with XRE-family HTH domain